MTSPLSFRLFKALKRVTLTSSLCLMLFNGGLYAQEVKSVLVNHGEALEPWAMSLQFGQTKIENKQAKTTKSSLVASVSDGDVNAINFVWRPRGVKNQWGSEDKSVSTLNVINSQYATDLTTASKNMALLLNLRINKAPNKHVELSMECNWDWQCRSTIPLKNMLKGLPQNEWLNVPVPVKCFDDGNFDLSKVTTPFILYTGGRMDIDIRSISLITLPEGAFGC